MALEAFHDDDQPKVEKKESVKKDKEQKTEKKEQVVSKETPIDQQKFIENTLGQAGQATAYLKFIAENIKPDVQPTNVGTWMPTTADGTGTGSANTT